MSENQKQELQIGSVVYSKMGRDAGRYYIVVKLDDSFCYIADGNLRRLNNLKKKNVKHVKNSGQILPLIAKKIIDGKKVFDAEVNSALRDFNQTEGTNA